LKVSTRIKGVDDRLLLEIPKIIVKNGNLKPGDKLVITLQGEKLMIENRVDSKKWIEKIAKVCPEDIFSTTLTEEELILAK